MTYRGALLVTTSLLALGLAGCGSPPVAAPVVSTAEKLPFGPSTLRVGMVWQLTDPGGGTPRESLTITALHGPRVVATIYLTSMGSLIQTKLHGRLHNNKILTLSGTVSEAGLMGHNKSLPVNLKMQPGRPGKAWVTQNIQGDVVNSFSQISFRHIEG